jgi:hypothetical protein
LAQARWGIFFSWQLGHSESECFDKASWARRVEVRLCEWRRFGLGMENSSLRLAAASEIKLRYISNSRLAVVTPAIPRFEAD